jgi:hypothetical protein
MQDAPNIMLAFPRKTLDISMQQLLDFRYFRGMTPNNLD